jgi:pimeloyl-ACP methyl ester carboxylesterase
MSKKPTVVLVPGAWHAPKIYNKIIPLLESHGYKCRAILLPSIQHPLNKNYEKYYAEDVAAIRDRVSKIIEEGEDVVLVLHSYGGLVGPDALPGLGKKERTEKGEKGGVVRLVYINAWLVPENFCAASPAGDGNPSEVSPFITMNEKVSSFMRHKTRTIE